MLLVIKKIILRKKEFIWYDSENIKEKYYNINIILKYSIYIILFFLLFFFRHFYINIIEKIKIEIDNEFNLSLYENNINFSNYKTKIKPISFYFSEFVIHKNYYHNSENIVNFSFIEIVKKQVILAKNHGIYGFAIYYTFDNDNGNKINSEIADIFLENKDINFPFFLIWNNVKDSNFINNIENDKLNILKLADNKLDIFIKNIKKYLISKIYIRINDKPAISIVNPLIFQNLNKTLIILRAKARENGIGEIFVFCPLINYFNDSDFLTLFDGTYDISKKDLLETKINKKIFHIIQE